MAPSWTQASFFFFSLLREYQTECAVPCRNLQVSVLHQPSLSSQEDGRPVCLTRRRIREMYSVCLSQMCRVGGEAPGFALMPTGKIITRRRIRNKRKHIPTFNHSRAWGNWLARLPTVIFLGVDGIFFCLGLPVISNKFWTESHSFYRDQPPTPLPAFLGSSAGGRIET